MRNCKYLIILILLLTNKLSAQDLTGLWKGTLFNDTTQQFYRYEIAISEKKGKLTGFSHTWFILDDKQYYGVKKVKIKKQDGKIIVEDAELIANNYPIPPAKNVRQLNVLTLEIKDNLMFLTGPFSTNQTKVYSTLTGNINVQRRSDFWQSALVPHLQELSLAKNLSFVQEEEKVIAKKEENKRVEENAIAKKEADKMEKERQEAALAAVVVNKKDIKKEKLVVKKEEKENNNPVAVAKKIVPVTTEVAKQEEPVVKTSIPVKKEESLTKAVVKQENKPVVKTSIPIKKEESLTRAVVKQENKPVTNTSIPIKKEESLTKAVVKQETKSIQSPITGMPVAAENVNKRNTELQQTVYFKSDSLQLSLYDNGEVDGDTVSVLMNGNIIFAKERLSTNAVRKTIAIDPSLDSIQLVMYAENLGTIAPNTGLLVVKDGKDIYEIRFSGDFKKNAAIVFRRKSPGPL